MLEYAAFAVAFVVFLILSVIYLLPSNKKVTTVPGPQPVDLLEGNFPDIQACGSLHEFLMDIHEAYGPIASLWWGPRLTVSIASPKLFKEHSKVFDRPAPLFEMFEPLIGKKSIQFANGGEGRRRHAAYAKCYGPDTIVQYYETLQQVSSELVSKLSSMAPDEHIPVGQYMLACAIKAILRTSWGGYFTDDRIHTIRQAYDYVWHEMECRLKGDVPELSQERIAKFEKHKAVLHDMMKDVLQHRRNNPPSDGEYLVVDALLEVNEDDEETMQCDAITLLVGGFQTTGFMLTWALYFLASHPDAQDRLYEELSMVLGKEDVSPDNFDDLVYMRQVIDETLRCSVLGPYAARVQEIDVELGGHRIPAGTPVIFALGVVLQDSEIYPEPEKFDPDRFTEEAKRGRPGYSFEPFGFSGKRKCPGYRLAMLEGTILLADIIRKFKVDLVEGQVVIADHGLVTSPKEEIWITISRRK